MCRYKRIVFSAYLMLHLGLSGVVNASVDCDGKVCAGNWSELKEAIVKTGGEVFLNSDISVEPNDYINIYVSGTIFDGNGFTITGSTATDSSNKSQFLYLNSYSKDSPLIIKNVVFKDFSNLSNNGGVIFNNYKSIISSIEADFINNSSAKNGGAIYNNNKAEIGNIKGKFDGNTSQEWGGAIYNSDSIIGLISGTFTNNYAKTYAGAIYNGGYATIGNVNADFIGNNSSGKGGAIFNSGSTIGVINGNFSNNFVSGVNTEGGFINSLNGNIAGIKGTFIGNHAKGTGTVIGGAISLYGDKVGFISGEFKNNFVESKGFASGGAIDINSSSVIDLISGTFTNNYINSVDTSYGGAIHVSGNSIVKKIEADFTNNYVKSDKNAFGGALALNRSGIIESIKGVFRGNRVISDKYEAFGGAIYNNNPSTIGNIINSSFYDNYAQTGKNNSSFAAGGAIYSNKDLLITADQGKSEFSGNKVIYKDAGGNDVEVSNAIYMADAGIKLTLNAVNSGTIKFDDGIDGESGYLISLDGDSSGNILFNNHITNTGGINLKNTNVTFGENSFIDSYNFTAESGKVKQAQINAGGGLIVKKGAEAIDTTVNIGGKLTAETLSKLNGVLANGGSILDIDSGAILSGNIVIDKDAVMGGNYDYSQVFKNSGSGSLTLVGGVNGKLENSLVNTVSDKELNFSGGNFVISSDSITGSLQVAGWDGINIINGSEVKLEGDLAMPDADGKIYVGQNSVVNVAGNSPSNYTITGAFVNDGLLDFSHVGDDADDITTITGSYKALANAQMRVDVNPALNLADKLVVQGDVEGTTNVIVNAMTDTLPTGKILFVDASNDDSTTGAAFKIFRVNGSSYAWNAAYENNKWYMATDNIIPDGTSDGYVGGPTPPDPGPNPDPAPNPPSPGPNPNPTIKPSVVGEVMAYAALPSAALEQNRSLFRSINKQGFGKNKGAHSWVSQVYSSSDIKGAADYEAKISGLDFGFDLQSDLYNTLGVFFSFRNGRYDLDGKGDDFYSKKGSKIDLDSYIGGLYHHYNQGNIWSTAMVYGGIQKADISSDDGVNSSVSGREFGAGIEAGIVFRPIESWSLEPIIGLRYTQIDYNNAKDNYGKSAKYDKVSQIEVEVAVKVEKTWKLDEGDVKLYIKPGILKRFGSGDVQISGLDKFDGVKNQTLGRLETGISMEINEKLSGYGSVSHTFGSGYKNTEFNIGLKYSF